MRIPLSASLLLLLPTSVLCLTIQRPLPNTLHAAGLNLPVSWTIEPGENITALKVMLAQPEDTIVATLAENVDATKGSQGIQIPKGTVTGGNYFVVLEGNNNPSSRATRGPFNVIFGAASSSVAPPPSSSASASSSTSISATSSGSSSASSSTSTSSKSSSDDDSSPTSTSDESQETTDGAASSELNGGQVAGIVVGVVGALLVAGMAAFFVFVRRRRRNANQGPGDGADNANYYNESNGNSGYVIDAPQPRYGPPPPTSGYRNMSEPYSEPYNTMGVGMAAGGAVAAGVSPYSDPYNNASKTYQPSEAVATAGSYTMPPSTPTTATTDKPHSAM
ncbi:hypothetical protein BDA99DRAFT_561269 [Phascolomyces articulosus]|uniref:Uncharacterized protein n=1 Tax=Phascolomyces articulosus TaxID=60185 RepID=A0AAD5JX91_9FUNG|nr:hypothetical protein BDA99DRAFT_561269 [Phascolomyces articulosus]